MSLPINITSYPSLSCQGSFIEFYEKELKEKKVSKPIDIPRGKPLEPVVTPIESISIPWNALSKA